MKKKIIKIIILVAFIIFIYSLVNIIIWNRDNDKSEKLKIKTNDIIKNNSDPAKALLYVNPDIVGHIYVPDTSISYVVVQGKDNDYYLKHDLSKEYNRSGWIFADYRNRLDGTDKNIIIYGHDSMFSSLKNVMNENWHKKNKYISLNINDSDYMYEVFSIYETPKEDYYLKTDFNGDFDKFVSDLKNKSVYDFGVSISSSDHILTLSTCSHSGASRIVLHAKKIN